MKKYIKILSTTLALVEALDGGPVNLNTFTSRNPLNKAYAVSNTWTAQELE